MLLRSSSTLMLNSWLPQTKGTFSEPELVSQVSRTRSLSLTSSDDPTKKRMIHGVFDSEKSNARKTCAAPRSDRPHIKSSLREGDVLVKNTDVEISHGTGRICGNGGKGSTGSGGGGGGGGVSGFFENCSDHTDLYYQKMIEANPGNALLLGNYAKFLKEIRRDLRKAEEYCGRAILTNPNDPNVLSLYADIIWSSEKNAGRAETYYDQAVKTSPDDCYVLASYAHFLWDSNGEEDGAEEEQRQLNPAGSLPENSRRSSLTTAN